MLRDQVFVDKEPVRQTPDLVGLSDRSGEKGRATAPARTVPQSLALEPPTLLQRAADSIKQGHIRNAKAFPEQLKAMWRQGREDFLHVLLHAFPDSMALTREAGAPGEPTPQLITAGLTGKPIDHDMGK